MNTNIPRPEYLRPQFVREEWMNLNGHIQAGGPAAMDQIPDNLHAVFASRRHSHQLQTLIILTRKALVLRMRCVEHSKLPIKKI